MAVGSRFLHPNPFLPFPPLNPVSTPPRQCWVKQPFAVLAALPIAPRDLPRARTQSIPFSALRIGRITVLSTDPRILSLEESGSEVRAAANLYARSKCTPPILRIRAVFFGTKGAQKILSNPEANNPPIDRTFQSTPLKSTLPPTTSPFRGTRFPCAFHGDFSSHSHSFSTINIRYTP